jgi:GT2 family glycosyltransferase
MIVPLGERPSVIAIIPTMGVDRPRLERCIGSIDRSTADFAVGVVVVWNSLDDVPISIAGVTVLTPGLNLGFPGSLVHGRSRIDTDFVWVVQDDIIVRDGCLGALLAHLDRDDRVAAVAPVTVDHRGRIFQFRAGILTDDLDVVQYPAIHARPSDIDPTVELDFVVSSGMLVRTSAWDQVGGYDPTYFPLQWSDADFCRRLRTAGWHVALSGDAVIHHQLNGTGAGLLRDHFSAVNGARFRAAVGDARPTAPDAPSLDIEPALLAQIAVAASTQLVEFHRFASRRLDEQRFRRRLRHPRASLISLANSSAATRWFFHQFLAARSRRRLAELRAAGRC